MEMKPLIECICWGGVVVGWGNTQQLEPGFGASSSDSASVKAKVVNLIASVRTLMRSMLSFLFSVEEGGGVGVDGFLSFFLSFFLSSWDYLGRTDGGGALSGEGGGYEEGEGRRGDCVR